MVGIRVDVEQMAGAVDAAASMTSARPSEKFGTDSNNI
jgi:hypothetical protein